MPKDYLILFYRMRVVVNGLEFRSLRDAANHYGLSVNTIKTRPNIQIERVYCEGYWNEVDKESLKNIGRSKRKGVCLLIEDDSPSAPTLKG